jgi:hypothetical protein
MQRSSFASKRTSRMTDSELPPEVVDRRDRGGRNPHVWPETDLDSVANVYSQSHWDLLIAPWRTWLNLWDEVIPRMTRVILIRPLLHALVIRLAMKRWAALQVMGERF